MNFQSFSLFFQMFLSSSLFTVQSKNLVKTKLISVNTLYTNHLNTGLGWYWNGRFVSGCEMVQYSNDGLKTGLKKPVYGPKCLVVK